MYLYLFFAYGDSIGLETFRIPVKNCNCNFVIVIFDLDWSCIACFSVDRLDVVTNHCVISGKRTRASAIVYFFFNRSPMFV